MSGSLPLDRALLETIPLPWPTGGSKEGRGRVAVVGGSIEVPGAVLLAGVAALRVGAGKLRLATVASMAGPLAMAMPEALVMGLPETEGGSLSASALPDLIEKLDGCAVALGPGMTEDTDAEALTAGLVEAYNGPGLVLDAAALCALGKQQAALRARDQRIVITPHSGEMATMLGISKDEVEADRFAIGQSAAERFGVTVVMKGATTHVLAPDGRAWTFAGGGVGLGTSGSGDTLAGLIAGLMARGLDAADAALWGVYLHGEAGRSLSQKLGPLGFLAREIPDEVPRLMASFPLRSS